MRKVVLLSSSLIVGLILSQCLPTFIGGEYDALKNFIATPLLYICLCFIMINVGREFEIDKSHWRSYTADYFIAMATAALPWILIALYYVFVLLPPDMWSSGQAWRENLLLSRFAAPTSAGILFTMLATLHLTKSWVYQKIQVLAIFDDLDTILLMIPLQIMMIGLKWQMGVIIAVIYLLLWVGWRRMDSINLPQKWQNILLYSFLIFAVTEFLHHFSAHYFGEQNSIHIEVLLPAFILGVIIKHKHTSSYMEQQVSSSVSLLFMFLVGLSVPLVWGGKFLPHPEVLISQVEMMSWGEIILHVLAVSALSNIGKLMPLFFYRDRKLSERLAVSVGMFTRGEVGAGVIFIAISYNLESNALIISALTLVLNLILTGFFVTWVGRLAYKTYNPLPVKI